MIYFYSMGKPKTLVVGASTNPERYAFKAAQMLDDKGHEIYLYGLKAGEVKGHEIHQSWPTQGTIDTVTLYVGPKGQEAFYDEILHLAPRRVIMNPGTENNAFKAILEQNGIQCIEACTLVMLSTGQY
jgi:predicted CoA-binding protein